MADAQIFSGAAGDGFSDYTLPDSAEFTLKAVNAIFEDAGAGGDWLPAVVIFSDSGHVIARAADQAVLVTGGDDAEVSFFPGVKNAAAASGAVPIEWFSAFAASVVVPSSTIATFATFSAWSTNDAVAAYYGNGPGGFDPLTPSDTVYVFKAGIYFVNVICFWPFGAYNRAIRIQNSNYTWRTGTGLPSTVTDDTAEATLQVIQDPFNTGVEGIFTRVYGMIVMPSDFPSADLHLSLMQDSGANQTVSRARMFVTRFGDV